MPTPFYIHTRRTRLAAGLVRGETNLSIPGDLEYSLTDILDIEVFATRGAPDGLEPWSGDDNRLVEIALGECGQPGGGTWTLSGGGSALDLSETTLSATATPEQVKDAIVANSNATSSDVQVTGIPGFYRIEFLDALAETEIDALSADGTELTPRSIAGVFRKKDGGTGENAVQLVSLSLATLGYSADFSQNASEDGWAGRLRFDGTALVEAVRESGSENIVTNLVIRITDDQMRPFTYVRRGIRIWCQVIPLEALSDNPLTAQMLTALLESGIVDAKFASLTITQPGLHAMDEAVVQLDDAGTLDVPSPGKGNVLLVRRQADPAGGDTIAAFTGLVPGALYWLVHDDGATDPIRFVAHEIRDGGDPLPIRATSATSATVAGPTQVARTEVDDANYTVTVDDTLVAVIALTTVRVITLPDATTYPDNRILTVKDESGAAGTHGIIIETDGTQELDGTDAGSSITSNYGVIRMYSVGADWFTI